MNIRQRIALLVTLAFAALCGIGVYAISQASDSSRQVRLVTEGVVPDAAKAQALMSQLKDVQIAVMDILTAADDQSVSQIQASLAARKQALQKAVEEQLTLATSAAQKGLVAEAKEDLRNYIEAVDQTAQFRLAGQKELAEATMAASVMQYLRTIDDSLKTLQIEKTRSKDQAIETLNARLETTRLTLIGITAAAVVALVGVGIVLYRQTVLPIGRMEHKMTAIAASQDFSQRLEVTRMDEVGRSIVAFNQMVEKIQERNEMVRQKSADIHSMLHAVPQGILTIESGGRIHPEFSDHLAVILGTKDLAGRDVRAVLFEGSDLGADALSSLDAGLAAIIGEEEMNFEFNAHVLPLEVTRPMADGSRKILDLNWAPMPDGQGVTTRLLLCVRDVTELRALEVAARSQRRELALVGEILHVAQEKFATLVDSAATDIESCGALIREGTAADDARRAELVHALFRHMHTIKGNARTHALSLLAEAAHAAENTYGSMRQGTLAWDAERLLAELHAVRSLLAEYRNINEGKLGRAGPGRRGAVERYVMVPREQVQRLLDRLLDRLRSNVEAPTLAELHGAVLALGTERLEDVLAAQFESLPELAASLGKSPPVVTVVDADVRLQAQISGVLRDTFSHLLRNALDHGIESPALREAAGKPAAGRVKLSLELDAHHLRIGLQDDGRGLNLPAIRDRAVAAGLLDAEAPATAADVASLVFAPGLSTAQLVTDVSGRGVGMDAVRHFIEREGGDVKVELIGEAGPSGHQAFRTVVTLPARFGARVASAAHREAAREPVTHG